MQVVIPTMTCLHFSILWDLAHVSGTVPVQVRPMGRSLPRRAAWGAALALPLGLAGSCPSQPPLLLPQKELLALKRKVASFCSLCQSCLTDVDSSVQEQVRGGQGLGAEGWTGCSSGVLGEGVWEPPPAVLFVG